MKIHIRLKLYATLRRFTPASAERYPLEKGATVRELAEKLNLPAAEVKLVFVNNVKCGLDAVLADGDRVGLFPPIGGG